MPGPITDRARRRVGDRVPGLTLNSVTLQPEVRPLDGTDVAGMLAPILDALGELEDRQCACGEAS